MITAAAAASDMDGYFFVGFEGHWSEKVAHGATADEMASALAGIQGIGEVEVRPRATVETKEPSRATPPYKFGFW